MEHLSFRQIDAQLGSDEMGYPREDAIGRILALLWHPQPWVRYRACCTLTTRIFIPFGAHFMEWNSFPGVFARHLKARYPTDPMALSARRDAAAQTLLRILRSWRHAYTTARKGNSDHASDACEAIGRLDIFEAEDELLQIIEMFAGGNSEVRMAALTAMAKLPPNRLPLLWASLKHEDGNRRRRQVASAAVLAYLRNKEAVPYLLDVVQAQKEPEHYIGVLRPILLTLGNIGDTRALPLLNAIARDEGHPEKATARKAIQRLMKEAEGHEEVTLVRASGLSTLHQDTLLRPAAEQDELRSQELLRASEVGGTDKAEDR